MANALNRPQPAPPPRRRRARRAGFALLAAALVLALLEGLSWLALSVLEARPASWSLLAARRRDAGATAPRAAAPASEAADEATLPWVAGARAHNLLHPYLGFVERADPDLRRTAPRYRAEAATYGFPYNFNDLFYQPSADRLVVAVVGGSVAQQLAHTGRPTPLLERALAATARFRGREVRVLNLGLGGYKQPQQLMVVAYFLALGAHLDLVVNLDGFNEVALPKRDNVALGLNPFYPRGWNFHLGAIDDEERRQRGAIVLLAEARQRAATAAGRLPWRLSFTAGLLWRLADGAVERQGAERTEALLARPRAERDPQALGPEVRFASDDELFRALVAVWLRSSVEIHHLTAARGIEYHHFLQPNQYDQGAKRLTAAELRQAFDPASAFQTAVPRGYPLLRASADELRLAGVRFTDLSGMFATSDETIFADRCCHLNDRGVALLVERVVAAIEAERQPPR